MGGTKNTTTNTITIVSTTIATLAMVTTTVDGKDIGATSVLTPGDEEGVAVVVVVDVNVGEGVTTVVGVVVTEDVDLVGAMDGDAGLIMGEAVDVVTTVEVDVGMVVIVVEGVVVALHGTGRDRGFAVLMSWLSCDVQDAGVVSSGLMTAKQVGGGLLHFQLEEP